MVSASKIAHGITNFPNGTHDEKLFSLYPHVKTGPANMKRLGRGNIFQATVNLLARGHKLISGRRSLSGIVNSESEINREKLYC